MYVHLQLNNRLSHHKHTHKYYRTTNNITSITSVISSLRAETQEASITPERIGALLQQLANLIANCATDSQLANIQVGGSTDGVDPEEFDALKNTAIVNIASRVTRTAEAVNITLTLTEGDDDTSAVNISIPLASATLAGVISPTDYTRITGIANKVELENMGIRFLGDVGSASSPGEEAAAQLAIASATRIKWIIYKYGNNVGMIHQTHNATTTVQNLYFAGNKHSQRTITFTNNQRTAISSVGNWSSVGTDIGVSRTATTATIKLVHPFMENNAGVLALTIGQANSNYAGLMTKENLRILNSLDEQVNDMLLTMVELQSGLSNLQDSISSINDRFNSLDNRYVLKAKLFAFANPSTIVIPVRNVTSSGCTIASSVEVDIQLSAMDEDENSVSAMDCNVTWSLGTNDSVFHVEYEGGKRYVTFIADEDDYWQGNGNGKLTITLTDQNRNVSGSYEVILERSTSNS